MPGAVVHLLLARRVLGMGREHAVEETAAFLLGALGPDMGYTPGGDHLVSDVAHYVTPAALVRELVRSANCPRTRAFARGWATHVLADALIHPLINRAAATVVWGRPEPPLTFAEDPAAHVKVEQGLDAVVAGREPPTFPVGLFPWAVTRALVAAYRSVYGPVPTGRRVAATCRAQARFLPVWARYSCAVGWRLGVAPRGPGRGSLAVFNTVARLAALAPRSLLFALTHPSEPSEWLVGRVWDVVAEFPQRFTELEAREFEAFPDYNLDTGEVGEPALTYPLAVATREQLNRA